MKKLFLSALFMAVATTSAFAQTVVTPPADLQAEPYIAVLTIGSGKTYYQDLKIGFYNNNKQVYIQGLAYNGVPESWVLGTFDDDGRYVEIPETYLGAISYWGTDYSYWLGETEFRYNKPNEGDFYAPAGYSITGGVATETYSKATLKKLVERPAVPATPSLSFGPSPNGSTYVVDMSIPLVDVDDNAMLSDKLSYLLYYEKAGEINKLTFTTDKYKKLSQDMTEIPYNFTDYYDIDNYEIWMNQSKEELKTWTRLGLQTIYRGGGEEHESEIAWFDMAAYWGTGIQSVTQDKIDISGPVYNLQGQKVTPTQKGLYIINGHKVVIK